MNVLKICFIVGFRKHSTHITAESKQLIDSSQQHKHNSKSQKVSSSSPLQYLANIVDPARFYVDLASLQNTTNLPESHCQYDKLLDAVMCVSNKKISFNKQSKCRKHRTKNNDPPDIKELPPHSVNDENNTNRKSKKPSIGETKKSPHVVTGHTTSPHHLRHRNRQEDQARAMAQVVRWLEQEFSSNLKTREKKKQSNRFEQKGNSQSLPNSGSVERHEHHHVHEHIHHHYHHYQETPPLVV